MATTEIEVKCVDCSGKGRKFYSTEPCQYCDGKGVSRDLIVRLKRHAMNNYNRGGDFMIECWDMTQWKEYVAECIEQGSDYFKHLEEVMGLLYDHRKDVEATAF